MRSVRLFLQLKRSDQALLLAALPLTALVRLGLWLAPFRWWLPLLGQRAGRPARGPAGARPSAERAAWAVAAVSPFVPGATCLTQALAARLLLGWLGHPALVRIGVGRDGAGQFVAHAWVESGGRVVIGGSEAALAAYRALPSLQRGPR